jgi:hypothetical protein
VYLDMQWRDQHRWGRVATFVARYVRQARALSVDADAARESLESDLERITRWVEERLHGMAEVNAPGMACFACHAADLWVEFASPVPFEDEFTIADRPMLRQLACLDEDYTNALLVSWWTPGPHTSMKSCWVGCGLRRILRMTCMDGTSREAEPRPAISGGQVTATELGEVMVQAVLQTDGLVELIVPDARLAAYDGVGALLRYSR